MSLHPVMAAASALADVLAAENAALSRMDVPSANALLPAKQAATEALVSARRDGLPVADTVVLSQVERLTMLAAENKILLERAMAAQNQIMACIARAVPKALQNGRYGAGGHATPAQTIPPVALSARA